MSYPQSSGQFILDTDAPDLEIGAVLSQVQNGEEKVLSFGSRALSKEERRYCVTRKELLAIVFFMKYYRHYLLEQKFLVRSNHQPLSWIFHLKDPSGQMARWQETQAEYNFEIEYRPGKKHGNADGMS